MELLKTYNQGKEIESIDSKVNYNLHSTDFLNSFGSSNNEQINEQINILIRYINGLFRDNFFNSNTVNKLLEKLDNLFFKYLKTFKIDPDPDHNTLFKAFIHDLLVIRCTILHNMQFSPINNNFIYYKEEPWNSTFYDYLDQRLEFYFENDSRSLPKSMIVVEKITLELYAVIYKKYMKILDYDIENNIKYQTHLKYYDNSKISFKDGLKLDTADTLFMMICFHNNLFDPLLMIKIINYILNVIDNKNELYYEEYGYKKPPINYFAAFINADRLILRASMSKDTFKQFIIISMNKLNIIQNGFKYNFDYYLDFFRRHHGIIDKQYLNKLYSILEERYESGYISDFDYYDLKKMINFHSRPIKKIITVEPLTVEEIKKMTTDTEDIKDKQKYLKYKRKYLQLKENIYN